MFITGIPFIKGLLDQTKCQELKGSLYSLSNIDGEDRLTWATLLGHLVGARERQLRAVHTQATPLHNRSTR